LAEVRLQEGESHENALRRFKRKVLQEDTIKEVKRHSFYLKPGEKKRFKQALARKRSRKKTTKRAGIMLSAASAVLQPSRIIETHLSNYSPAGTFKLYPAHFPVRRAEPKGSS
jgi:small subunit ribosomal protein S21